MRGGCESVLCKGYEPLDVGLSNDVVLSIWNSRRRR